MNTEETILYLKAAYQAESGIAACEDLANILIKEKEIAIQQNAFSPSPNTSCRPEEPFDWIKSHQELIASEKQWLKGTSVFKYGLTTTIGEYSFHKKMLKELESSWDLVRKNQAKANAEYQRARSVYESEMSQFQRNEEARQKLCLAMQSALRDTFDNAIQDVNAKRQSLTEARQKLYDMGVLHPRFQNQVAVFQLCEYLEMGLCDQLQGPQGAYSFYLEDLRTNRICGSIEDLHETVRKGFHAVLRNQQVIITELQQLERHMFDLQTSINTTIQQGCQDLQTELKRDLSSLTRVVADSVAASQKMLGNIHAQQQRITDTIRTSAYNQYIELQHRHVNDYMRNVFSSPL